VTGYVEQSEALHESAGGAPVLLKPFSPEALLRAVSSTLQAARKEPRLMT
jgi:CheY-like chemotaxis protein